MTRFTQHASSDPESDGDFDLNCIFIAREQQLDLFDIYLTRWKQRLFAADPDAERPMMTPPSPNNKLQGLVVLLYGRGGFGKSTLLRRYREMALQEERHLQVSEIVDWEFAVEGKRGLFNPPPGQEVDPSEYFRVLCAQLAVVLQKDPKAFKEYQAAVKAVDEARKKASGLLESVQKDDRYAAFRTVTVEALMALVRSSVPGSGAVLDNPTVKAAADTGAKITVEQLSHIRTRLHATLGNTLGDYLDPALRLGLALGRDLAECAKNFPLLIFFDTYEEIDEADHLLRVVMGAAGKRVGWVLAGRDNLWAGSDQIERSIAMEYGYKDLVPSDRGLSVNFNAGDVGAFTISDIQQYFDLLSEMVHDEPALPRVEQEAASRIHKVTQGVPLAVKFAAGLYRETANLELVTEKAESKRSIVDQMVRRYLLHTRADQHERTKLYGLALLRRADQPAAIAAALGLSPEQAQTNYELELSRLHRRYSFIFTEKAQPALHQEVRYFLRLWLLERCKEPEVVAVNQHLKEAHEALLKKLEDHAQYATLKERYQDNEWVGTYLDLTEQQFWLDPVEGARYVLPFMIAAAIYRRDVNEDAVELGKFFEAHIRLPYREWWTWAAQSLTYRTSRNLPQEERIGLEKLVELAGQRCPTFPQSLLPEYRGELEAALWWRLGEAYRNQDNRKALEWYEKALLRLGMQSALREAAAVAARNVAYTLYQVKKYTACLPFLDRALELKTDYADAYSGRGVAYGELKQYERAILDFDRAIELDPNDARAYDNRGSAYGELKQYERAIQDFDRAIELDPNDTVAYYNRGIVYRKLKQYGRTIQDYDRAIELDPNDAAAYHNRGVAYLWLKNVSQARADYQRSYALDATESDSAWMAVWATMSKQGIGVEQAEQLENIASRDPQSYVACVCRGVALGLRGRGKEGLAEMESAIALVPEEWDAYFWKGMLSAYYYRGDAHSKEVVAAIEQSLAKGLPPILLTPLYWLEQDRPDVFVTYMKPLLLQYGV